MHNKDFDAHRYLRETKHGHPRRRITDINRRAYAYLAVIVAVILALWGTL